MSGEQRRTAIVAWRSKRARGRSVWSAVVGLATVVVAMTLGLVPPSRAAPAQSSPRPRPPPESRDDQSESEVAPPLPDPLSVVPPMVSADAVAQHVWEGEFVRVAPPRYTGVPMLIAAGATIGATAAFQLINALTLRAGFGVFERALAATSVGLAAGGGVRRGRALAYDDAVLQRKRRGITASLAVGAAAASIGVVIGVTNEALWWRCVANRGGPYHGPAPSELLGPSCRFGPSRILLDASALASATGLGLFGWALTYRRHARAYRGARVYALSPKISTDSVGFVFQGRL